MILFALFIYRCIKRFPFLLVIIFCTATLSPRVFIEQDVLEEVVELESEKMDFHTNVIVAFHETPLLKTGPYKLFNKTLTIETIYLNRKSYLVNCSLKYCG